MDSDSIGWTVELETGIPLIDSQHKAFYQYIAYMHNENIKGLTQEIAVNHINNIYKFAAKHFTDEQSLMIEYNYPYLNEHKQKHDLILNELSLFRTKAKTQNLDSSTIMNFICSLSDWFKNQTLVDDKKMVACLKDDPKFKWKLKVNDFNVF